MKNKILLTFYLIFLISGIYAQEIAGSLIYAEGLEFSILRGQDYISYNLYEDDAYATRFYPGDIIITENNTFLEIQLVPSKNVLKISENTSFQIQNLGVKGSGRFSLTYGRVRAKVHKLVDKNSFEISGPSIAAGVRGTDFGYDIIAGQNETDIPETKIYCFDGEVEVKKIDSKIYEKMDTTEIIEEDKDSVIIKANEMVVIEDITDNGKKDTAISKKVLSSEIKEFWKENDFKAEPQKIINKANEELKKEMIRNSSIMFSIGTMAEIAGMVIYFNGENTFDNNETVGASLVAAGGLMSLASITNFIKARSLD